MSRTKAHFFYSHRAQRFNTSPKIFAQTLYLISGWEVIQRCSRKLVLSLVCECEVHHRRCDVQDRVSLYGNARTFASYEIFPNCMKLGRLICMCGATCISLYLPFCPHSCRPPPSSSSPPSSDSPSLACGCNEGSGGIGPDEAEKGSTAALSLWLPAPSPPPHIMNNGTEKYIYLLIASAP